MPSHPVLSPMWVSVFISRYKVGMTTMWRACLSQRRICQENGGTTMCGFVRQAATTHWIEKTTWRIHWPVKESPRCHVEKRTNRHRSTRPKPARPSRQPPPPPPPRRVQVKAEGVNERTESREVLQSTCFQRSGPSALRCCFVCLCLFLSSIIIVFLVSWCLRFVFFFFCLFVAWFAHSCYVCRLFLSFLFHLCIYFVMCVSVLSWFMSLLICYVCVCLFVCFLIYRFILLALLCYFMIHLFS